MKLVAIPEERFLELVDIEKSSQSCRDCGALAQRDRTIEAKDEMIPKLTAERDHLSQIIRDGTVRTPQVEMNRAIKKYELAAACIGGVSNILQGGAGDAMQNAMSRIRDYYNDLEAVEKEWSK